LHLVEFTDVGVACHVLDTPVKASGDGLPALPYGVFPWRDTIGVVTADGALNRLGTGKQSGPLNVDLETAASERPEENEYNFVTLATFWQAQHEKKSAIVTDELGKQCGSLLLHSSLKFMRKNAMLTISSNSRNPIICGIGIDLGFVPPTLLPVFGVAAKCIEKNAGQLVMTKKMTDRYRTMQECCEFKDVKSLQKTSKGDHETIIQMRAVSSGPVDAPRR
jgi:hypothetical protein